MERGHIVPLRAAVAAINRKIVWSLGDGRRRVIGKPILRPGRAVPAFTTAHAPRCWPPWSAAINRLPTSGWRMRPMACHQRRLQVAPNRRLDQARPLNRQPCVGSGRRRASTTRSARLPESNRSAVE
jgi:hypothetical protein